MGDLLEFVPVTGFHPLLPPFTDEAGEEGFRGEPVALLQNLAGLGIGDETPGRRKAYVDLMLFGADAGEKATQLRAGLADCPIKDGSCINSSCAMFIRSVWRLLGARSDVLDPLRSGGTVYNDLLRFAAEVEAGEPVDANEVFAKKGAVTYSETKRLRFPPPEPPEPPAPPTPPADAAQRDAYLADQAAFLDAKRDHVHARARFEGRRKAYDEFLATLKNAQPAEPSYPPDPPPPSAPDAKAADLSFEAERARHPQEVAWHKAEKKRFDADARQRDEDDLLDEVRKRQATQHAPLVWPDPGREGLSKAQLLDLDPKPGDVVFITKGHSQHVFTLVHREGDVFYSVDGGQAGTNEHADGKCCGIKSVRRTLQANGTFTPDDAKRPIIAFVRFDRLVDRLAFGGAPMTKVKVDRTAAGMTPVAPVEVSS